MDFTSQTDINLNLIPGLTETTMEEFLKEGFPEVEKTEKPEKTIPLPGGAVPEEVESEEVTFDQQEESKEEDINKVWASFGKEKGFFDYKDEEITPETDMDEFIVNKYNEAKEKGIKTGIDEYKETLPEPIKQILNHYEEGVPLMDLLESESRLTEYSAIKPEEITADKGLQEEIVQALYQSQGYTSDEIKSKMTKLDDSGLLEDEAQLSIKKLIQLENKYKQELITNSKKQEELRKQEVLDGTKAFEERIKAKKELFKDIPYTEDIKKKVINAILKPVGKSKTGQPINLINKAQQEDPDFLEKLAYMVVNNWDLEAFKRQATTQATKKLKDITGTYKESTGVSLTKNDLAAKKWAEANKRKQQLF